MGEDDSLDEDEAELMRMSRAHFPTGVGRGFPTETRKTRHEDMILGSSDLNPREKMSVSGPSALGSSSIEALDGETVELIGTCGT